MYLDLTLKTDIGEDTKTFSIDVGGTAWINNGTAWTRAVPYQPNTQKPCIMYTNINGNWIRGNP
jgi:hypothetical protein